MIGSPRRSWRAAVGEISVGWERGPQTCSQLGQSWVYSPTRFERHDDKPLALHAGRFLACFLRKISQEWSCRFAAAIVVRSKDSRLFRTRHGRTTPSNTQISNPPALPRWTNIPRRLRWFGPAAVQKNWTDSKKNSYGFGCAFSCVQKYRGRRGLINKRKRGKGE